MATPALLHLSGVVAGLPRGCAVAESVALRISRVWSPILLNHRSFQNVSFPLDV